ncbi:hypothetical protein [Natronobiforma cellulositropha]|uniref:hypothetical protein n=1 Tax=Natronobiforma cellulositropha TaxID=1679076 RepID=UPI0021D5F3E9|nr:hypothetical protein [Natronobiforma cellulositropha]
MLGDGNPIGNEAGNGSVDPSQPLLLLLQQLETVTSSSIDDPEALVDSFVQDVLELPPEERFEQAVEVVEERLEAEFGSVDVFEAKFPLAPAIAFELFQRFLDEWGTEVAEKALQENRRNKNGLLVLLATVDVLQEAAEVLKAAKESDESEQEFHPETLSDLSDRDLYRLGSVVFSLYARIYREVKANQRGETPDFAALATDILYGERTIVRVLDPEFEYPSIEAIRDRQKFRGVLNRGALKAYDQLDISIARGAELAELTQNEFVELLESSGMRAEYGPDSIEDFYSGPDLMDE